MCHAIKMKPFLVYLLLSFYPIHAYKILIYSSPLGYSHTIFLGRIADILCEDGHDVTVLHPVWQQQPSWVISTKAKKVLFPLPDEIVKDSEAWNARLWKINPTSIIDQVQFLIAHTELQLRTCDLLLGDNDTMHMLRNEHFDAGITEMLGACGFGIFYKLGIDHMIAASATAMLDTMSEYCDIPKLPSIVPSVLLPYSNRMNFLERAINMLAHAFADFVSYQFGKRYKRVWSRHGVETDEQYYKDRINYLLLNSDEFLDFAQPTSPKIVYIGGITLQEITPLSERLQKIMERTKKGVVYISFGSAIPTKEMPKHFREGITEVARTFKDYDFIWKVDEGDSVQGVPNLHLFNWVQQAALIAHPGLRCFVSHAGMNSILELTRSGKPSILVPVFADQLRNALLVEVKNTTIVISKEKFNHDTFAAALQQILSDEGYSQRAERLASLMKTKPFAVKDRLLSTVNFSIQHGRFYDLDSGRHLNTIQYYSVDVVLFLITFLVATIFMSFYICRFLCRKISRRKVKSD